MTRRQPCRRPVSASPGVDVRVNALISPADSIHLNCQRDCRDHRGWLRASDSLPPGHELALPHRAAEETLGLQLRRDPAIVGAIERRFAEHGWKMSPNNVKQGDVITGATVLMNANGTAPGQWISGKSDGKEKIIVLLPGPPHELKALFEGAVLERLRVKVPAQFPATRVLKITGLGESACDARVAPIYKRFPDVDTTILAGAGEIQLHLKTLAASSEQADKRLDDLVDKIEAELGDNVF